MSKNAKDLTLNLIGDDDERKRIIRAKKSFSVKLNFEETKRILLNDILPKFYKTNKEVFVNKGSFFYDNDQTKEFSVIEASDNMVMVHSKGKERDVWVSYEILKSIRNKKTRIFYRESVRLEKPIDLISPQGQLMQFNLYKDTVGRAKFLKERFKEV